MRYFIEFAYNGKNFHGFQSQPDASSVQETLEKALTTLFREPIAIVGAGRTDTGVHAKQMFAHFETELELESDYWSHKLNSFLPPSIVIYRIFSVHPDAHARFDATSRTYEYYMHTFKDAFIVDGSWYHSNPLDIQKMNEAKLKKYAKEQRANLELVKAVRKAGKLPVVNFAAGGIATPADAALLMQMGCEGVFVGSGIFKSKNPAKRARAIVLAVNYANDPEMLAKVSEDLEEAMSGIQADKVETKLQERGKNL